MTDPATDRVIRIAQADTADAIGAALAANPGPEGIAACIGIAHEGDRRIAAIVAEGRPPVVVRLSPNEARKVLRFEVGARPLRRVAREVCDAD